MRNTVRYLSLSLLITFQWAQGQLRYELNTLISLPEEGITSTHAKLISPLGPKAASLYAASYEHSFASPEEVSVVAGLWIDYKGNKYQYQEGKIWAAGQELTKSRGHLRRLGNYLRKLETGSPYARNIIRTLSTSHNLITIKVSNCDRSYMVVPVSPDRMGVLNNNAYAFQVLETNKTIVDYAPHNRIGSGAEIRWNPNDNMIKLAHELGHAYDANFGLMDDRLMIFRGQAMVRREVRAIYHENMIRKELDWSLRTSVHDIKTMIENDEPLTYLLPDLARH